MTTDRLQEFLSTWCNVESDPADAVPALTAQPPTDFAIWLQGDLTDAIRAGDLTPETCAEITDIAFSSQHDVDAWLRECWRLWFPSQPFPTD